MCTKCVLCLKSLIFVVHNTSLKDKNIKEYLEFVLEAFHKCIFYNAGVPKKKFILHQVSFCSLRSPKYGCFTYTNWEYLLFYN